MSIRSKNDVDTFGYIIVLIILGVMVTGWVKNLIKLSECDFEPSYKAEIMHTVGLFPIVGVFTGYMDFGK